MWILILLTCNPDCTTEPVEAFKTEAECVAAMEQLWEKNEPHASACVKREEYDV